MVTTIPEKFSVYDQDQKVVVLDCGTLTAVPNKHYILPGDSLGCFLFPGDGPPPGALLRL